MTTRLKTPDVCKGCPYVETADRLARRLERFGKRITDMALSDSLENELMLHVREEETLSGDESEVRAAEMMTKFRRAVADRLSQIDEDRKENDLSKYELVSRCPGLITLQTEANAETSLNIQVCGSPIHEKIRSIEPVIVDRSTDGNI